MKKFFIIASTEYEANMPDLFVMDTDGNYYGVSNNSYAKWHNFPKDIDHWRNSEGSDAGRYFNIDEVEIPVEKVEEFDMLTKDYLKLDAETPVFNRQYPVRFNYTSGKAYDKAITEFMSEHEKWCKESNVAYYISAKRNIWLQRTELFCTFSQKVYDAIKNNHNIL